MRRDRRRLLRKVADMTPQRSGSARAPALALILALIGTALATWAYRTWQPSPPQQQSYPSSWEDSARRFADEFAQPGSGPADWTARITPLTTPALGASLATQASALNPPGHTRVAQVVALPRSTSTSTWWMAKYTNRAVLVGRSDHTSTGWAVAAARPGATPHHPKLQVISGKQADHAKRTPG